MADLLAAKRGLMACRVYLKLYDAGPAGAPVTKDDALGPGDDPAVDFAVALEVIARFVDDTVLDEPGHAGGVPHYALTRGMRDRMAGQAEDGAATLADRLRDALAAADRGAGGERDWAALEARIRTGTPRAAPL